MAFIKLFFFSLQIITAELPVLFSKQPTTYVRFISKDGKYTYYLTRSGSLMVSSNYQTSEVIKGHPGTNYLIVSSPSRKILIMTRDKNYFDFMSQREANTLYKLEFGSKSATKIGYGINPKLHLDDTWVSYFNIQENSINLQNLVNDSLLYKIILNNKLNPYFIPQVIMLEKDKVIYTDLGAAGEPGISIFNKSDKKSKLLFKGALPSEKVEICLMPLHLVVGHFGFMESKKGSQIDLISLSDLAFSSKKTIYQSEKNDIGNIICEFDKNIYFIKNFSSNINQVFEAVSLNINTKEEKKLTEILNATQLIQMDDKLLLSAFGKIYVLIGRSDYQKDEFEIEAPKKKEKK